MIPTPFTNIAVSLSGGGYRATTFHLGALAYLNNRSFEGNTLLNNVRIISTISGGTITGVMYSLFLAEEKSFEDCFNWLYELLEKDELVDHALHKLNNPTKWKNKHKTRDVINAFSEVYNEHFYDGATFAKLYDAKESHIKDAIFGSSEFTYGIQFRLQEEHDRGKFGNFYLNLPKDAAREIRLADAVAASSCFPGGFEPIVMPNDFGNGPDSLVNKSWFSKEYQGVKYPETAIMDGGIIDNQGIEGVKLAEQRHAKSGSPYIGTYIVSDVSGEMMEPYKVPTFKYSQWKNFISLNTINIIAFALIVVLAAILIFANPPFWGIITASAILPFPIIWFILFYSLKSVIQKEVAGAFGQTQSPEIFKDLGVLLKTPLYILFYLLKFRATSVLVMVMSIFMRRIRRLQLDTLYGSPEWFYRFKSNYIYALEKDDSLPEGMKKTIKAANTMPTTLWFSDKEKKDGVLDDLIACGQFTMCHNLIKYTKKLKTGEFKKTVWDKLSKEKQKEIEDLQKLMEKDWEDFKKDPYWLLNNLKRDPSIRA
jgi:predicted acylesterase/phospholipase RssA